MTLTSTDETAAPFQEAARVTADDFKAAFRGHPGGVALITADSGTGPVALTATSVVSVSVEPPLLVFSLSRGSSASGSIAASDTLVVHLLDEQDLDLARKGSTSGIDRFADPTEWARLATGEPVFPRARAWLRCGIVNRMDAGDSTVIAVRALQLHIARDVAPGEAEGALVYHNRSWHRLGAHSVIG